ncbi:hypothetical protein DICSQDRAFT_37165, partial [Dichomitus squalens LYAD-421 SS1]|uniref:uncharacterized protein n=2 Tax=Dichomitus squalens (strain LYAD-421) TaxID=732165 RepID=UPI0004414B4A
AIRDAKRAFFEQRIHDVATNNARVWDLTAWYKPRRSDTADIVDSLGNPILTPEDLRDNAGPTFHSAEGRPVDLTIVDSMPALPARDWPPFSRQELLDALHATNSRSAPGWDHITWKF